MKLGLEDLVKQIKAEDQKMQLISKPFGGYRNVLEIDDIYFEDPMVSDDIKKSLKITKKEEDLSVKFNTVATAMGMHKDTRWGRAAIILVGIWTLYTSLVCFQKPDFLNVSSSFD